jgi:hypothetical protein
LYQYFVSFQKSISFTSCSIHRLRAPVKVAMASYDVFDLNFAEIDAWLLFLLGYEDKRCFNENEPLLDFHRL